MKSESSDLQRMTSGHVGGHEIFVDQEELKKLCLSICGLILTTGDNFNT
jgi:hypothetical protein